jgi:hypothetical protein
MLMIPTFLKESDIPYAGIGLFTAKYIPKGSIIWLENSNIDLQFDSLDSLNLSQPSLRQINKYAWFDKDRNIWILPGDDTRFINHSETPNCDDSMLGITTALIDIKAGEELTVDYRTFHTGNIFD